MHLLISGVSKNSVPIWLHEGIAKFTETAWRAEPGLALSVEAQERLGAKGTNSVCKMHPSMAKLETQESLRAFSEVFTFIEFLCERKGWNGMRSFSLRCQKVCPWRPIEKFTVCHLESCRKMEAPSVKFSLLDGKGKGDLEFEKRSSTPDDKFYGCRKNDGSPCWSFIRSRSNGCSPERVEKAYTITESPLLRRQLRI